MYIRIFLRQYSVTLMNALVIHKIGLGLSLAANTKTTTKIPNLDSYSLAFK